MHREKKKEAFLGKFLSMLDSTEIKKFVATESKCSVPVHCDKTSFLVSSIPVFPQALLVLQELFSD